jgi:hypothetical protein
MSLQRTVRCAISCLGEEFVAQAVSREKLEALIVS